MISGSIARRYAKALFAISEDQGNLLGLHREVQRMAEIWSGSEDLRTTLTNPLLKASSKRKVWETVITRIGVSIIAKRFFSLLFDKSRLNEIPGIARELSVLADEKENRLRAEVVSAKPVPEAVVVKLKAALQKRSGKMIVLTRREDPDLVGGIITRVGDLMYDGSLKTHFTRMKEAMLGQK